MSSLKMAFHSGDGRRIVEVYDNSGKMVACIYPDDANNGIRVISKYETELLRDRTPPSATTIKFSDKLIPGQDLNMYDVAKRICLEAGMPWTDPRTGETHKP